MRNPKLIFAAGTEKYVMWAKHQHALMEARRANFGVPAMTKALSPAPGVVVWMQATPYGGWIRISGAAGYYLAVLIGDACACNGIRTNVVFTDYTAATGALHLAATFRQAQTYNDAVVWNGTTWSGTYDESEVSVTTPGSPGTPGEAYVQGGTIDVEINGAFAGSVPVPASPGSPDDGFNAAATVWYASTGPLTSYTEQELKDLSEAADPPNIYEYTFTPDGIFYWIGAAGAPTADSTTVTLTQTYVNWYNGSVVVNGTKTTTTVDAGAPSVVDGTTTQSVAVFAGAYPLATEANTCGSTSGGGQNTGGWHNIETTVGAVLHETTYWNHWSGGVYIADAVFNDGTQTVDTTPPNWDVYTFTAMPGFSAPTITNPVRTGAAWKVAGVQSGPIRHGVNAPQPSADPASLADASYYRLDLTGTWTDPTLPADEVFGYVVSFVLVPEYDASEASKAVVEAARIATCRAHTEARLVATLESDAYARDTFWDAAEDLFPYEHLPTVLVVESYAVEYLTAGGWTVAPLGTAVTAARVRQPGHKEGAYPPSATKNSPRFAGRQVSVTTAPVALVYMVDDPSVSDDTAAQRTAFKAFVVAAGGVASLSDANKVKALFFPTITLP